MNPIATWIGLGALLSCFLASADQELRIPARSSTPKPNALDWADVLQYEADPAVVTNAQLRESIAATGLPWRVRHKATGVEMLLIPPGEFVMGKSPGDSNANGDELPAHEVSLTKPFYLGRYEITQQQWAGVTKVNPSQWKKFEAPTVSGLMEQRVKKMLASCVQDGMTRKEAQRSVSEALMKQGWERSAAEEATLSGEVTEEQAGRFVRSWSPPRRADNAARVEWPVEAVSWTDCRRYCATAGLRLPTEAEWEFACRAGSRTPTYGRLEDVAWHTLDYEDGKVKSTAPRAVGTKAANGLGLYDMLGNVYEWVADYYAPYDEVTQRDPNGPSAGEFRVFRGGGDWKGTCRASARYKQSDDYLSQIGLRVARDP
jgi:sulfatase modifying factor 1